MRCPLRRSIGREKLIWKWEKEETLTPVSVICLLLQSYLEAFYKFCKDFGDVTAEVMCPILEVRVLAFPTPGDVPIRAPPRSPLVRRPRRALLGRKQSV